MKYFIDTEFLEGQQKTWFGKTKPTIDLISIGIVAEDGREYYAISKDFNVYDAWNNEWLPDNVLFPIWKELSNREYLESNKSKIDIGKGMTYNSLKKLINKYGKTNKQIAEEIKEFTSKHLLCDKLRDKNNNPILQIEADATTKKFYGYYSDYDWVVFCWLFGKMIDLPKGFPMYCNDLKQTLDEKLNNKILPLRGFLPNPNESLEKKIKEIKNYPKQTNEHNALSDARWNFELYKFINKL